VGVKGYLESRSEKRGGTISRYQGDGLPQALQFQGGNMEITGRMKTLVRGEPELI